MFSKSRYAGLGLGMLILAIGVSSLSAQGVSSIAQGFQTSDPNVVAGAIVSLKQSVTNNVELTTPANLQQMIGVAGTKSLIELSGSGTVQVVTDGTTATLVSDINGAVQNGDKITASPIAGVGMKATTSTLVVGTAQESLSDVDTTNRTVTDTKGKTRTVHIGAIPIQVDKVFYEASSQQSSFLPSGLQGVADGVAGHQVTAVRVVIAGLLVLLLFIIVSVLLYSTVKSSIISIGRNPLSENAVHKSLLEVGITVVGVFVFTIVTAYIILIT